MENSLKLIVAFVLLVFVSVSFATFDCYNLSRAYAVNYSYNSTSPTAINNMFVPVYLDTTNSTLWNNTGTAGNCTNARITNSTYGELDYEYVSGCGTSNATFWVSANVSAQTTNTTIVICLGNTTDTNASHITSGASAKSVWTRLGGWNVFHLQETGSSIIDSSGVCNGTITGTVTSVAGLFGNARNFSGGANYITTCAHTFADANNSQFIVAWAKYNVSANRKVLVSNYKSDYLGFGVETGSLFGGTNRHSFFVGNGAALGNATTGEVGENTWNMMSGAYDGTGGSVRVYLNSTNIGNNTASAYSESTNANRIGATPIGTTVSWNGTIDEIYMFDGEMPNINNVITAAYGGFGSVGAVYDTAPITSNDSVIVSLGDPANNTTSSNLTTNFHFTATSLMNATLACNLYVNTTIWATNASVLNNTDTYFYVNNLTLGNWSWYVSCTGNVTTNSSATWTYTMLPSCVGATTNFVCGDAITESCTLNGNLTSVGNCFIAGVPDITINCSNFSITGDGTGIAFSGLGDNEKVYDCFLSNFAYGIGVGGGTTSVYDGATTTSNYVSSGTLYRYWSARPYTRDKTGAAVASADVNIYNNANTLISSQTTGGTGYGAYEYLLQFTQTSITTAYSTPYLFAANKTGYNSSTNTTLLNVIYGNVSVYLDAIPTDPTTATGLPDPPVYSSSTLSITCSGSTDPDGTPSYEYRFALASTNETMLDWSAASSILCSDYLSCTNFSVISGQCRAIDEYNVTSEGYASTTWTITGGTPPSTIAIQVIDPVAIISSFLAPFLIPLIALFVLGVSYIIAPAYSTAAFAFGMGMMFLFFWLTGPVFMALAVLGILVGLFLKNMGM